MMEKMRNPRILSVSVTTSTDGDLGGNIQSDQRISIENKDRIH